MSYFESLRWSAEPPADESARPPSPVRAAVAKLVLETTAEGVWLIDAQDRTTFVNRRLADLLGYAEDEMVGQSVFAFLDPTRWPIAKENLQKRRRGIEDRQEVELIRKDGTRVWVIGSANPVFDGSGSYAGTLALLGDLTSQKERERRLQSQVDELTARLARASRALGSHRIEPPPYREPFRTAIVLGTYGTLMTTVAVVTVGAVLSSALGVLRRQAPEEL